MILTPPEIVAAQIVMSLRKALGVVTTAQERAVIETIAKAIQADRLRLAEAFAAAVRR